MASLAIVCLLTLGSSFGTDARNPMKSLPKAAAITVKRDVDRTAIVPELRPKSDNKFMHDDLPADERPRENGLAFEHPYPVIQESHNYDYDFVKDENGDNGEYQAQMTYDELRSKMHKIIMETEAAKREMEAQEKDLEKAKEREAKAEEIAEDAETSTGKAKGVEVDKSQTLEDLRGKTAAASNEVEREIMELQECKRQLEEAKDRLAKLLAAKAAAEGQQQSASAVVSGADAEITEEEWEIKVSQEYTEWMAAKRKLEEEQAELKDIQERLAAAEKRLRKYRHNPEYVDPDGGVYYTGQPKKAPSGAAHAGFGIITAMAVAVAASFSN